MAQPDSIGVRELRQHASRYLALVKAGQRVPVTERGKLIAYIVPVDEPETTYDRLVAAGQIRPATGEPLLAGLLPVPAPSPGDTTLSEVLQEMREERY